MSAVAWSRSPLEASSQPGQEQGVRAGVRRGGSPAAARAARIRRDPSVPAPSTTQAQPNPRTMSRPSIGSAGLGPGQCLVDVGPLGADQGEVAGLLGAAYAGASPGGGLGVPGGVRPAGSLGLAARGQLLQAERPDTVQHAVAQLAARARDPPGPASGRPAGSARRSPWRPAAPAPPARPRRPRAEPRRRSRTAPRARVDHRGTAGRSSSRSPRGGCAAGPGGGRWDRSSRVNRSSIRRAISGTESTLTRAAASSIASGSPSSDWQRASTAAPVR